MRKIILLIPIVLFSIVVNAQSQWAISGGYNKAWFGENRIKEIYKNAGVIDFAIMNILNEKNGLGLYYKGLVAKGTPITVNATGSATISIQEIGLMTMIGSKSISFISKIGLGSISEELTTSIGSASGTVETWGYGFALRLRLFRNNKINIYTEGSIHLTELIDKQTTDGETSSAFIK